MLQWMGGSRKKIKQTRNSLQARQRKFFEQRRHQQRDEVAIQNANEGSRQRPESLDLLGLEKLCSVLAPLKVRKESSKAPGYTELCKDICKEEMKILETNAASKAEAEQTPASPAAAVKSTMEKQVAKSPIQAPTQKRSPCKRGITLLDIVGDTEMAKNKSSSEAYAAFALEGTGILGKDTPPRRQTGSVDMLSRFETHEHNVTTLKDGQIDFMDIDAVLGVQVSGVVPWHAPAKEMDRCLRSSESYDANEWQERFALPAKQRYSAERRNAGRLDIKPDKAEDRDAFSAAAEDIFPIDGAQSTRSKCENLKVEHHFMRFHSMGIEDASSHPAKDMEAPWQTATRSYETNIWNELIPLPVQQSHAAATKNEGWLDDGAEHWTISPTASAEDMLCFDLDEVQSTCSNGGQLQDERVDLVFLPPKQSDTAATRNEGWLHDKEDHWNISPIAFAGNMLIGSGVDEAQSKDGQLKHDLGKLISLPAKQSYAAATRNEDWSRDDEDRWNISPITSAEVLQSFRVNEEQSTCSEGGQLNADFLDRDTVLGVQKLSCNARKHSAKFKEVAWEEDNVWDDLISPPAKPSARTRNEGLRHGHRDDAVDLSIFPEDVLTSFEKDEEQTTILEGRHLKDEPDMMEMNTFLGVESELTWHRPAKEVPLQRGSESNAEIRHELFSQQNYSAERRTLNVKRDLAEHMASSKEQENIDNVRDDKLQIGSLIKMEGSTSPLFDSPQGINQQRDRFSKEENINADCESCSGKGEIGPNPKNCIQSVLLKLKKPQDCKERKQYSCLEHSTCPCSGDVHKDVLSTASCSEQKLQMPETGDPANSFVNQQFKLSSQRNSSTGDQEPPCGLQPDNCDLGMVDEDNDSGNTKERSPAVVKKPPENITGQEFPSDEISAHENSKYVRMLESYILQLQCMNKALLLDGQK